MRGGEGGRARSARRWQLAKAARLPTLAAGRGDLPATIYRLPLASDVAKHKGLDGLQGMCEVASTASLEWCRRRQREEAGWEGGASARHISSRGGEGGRQGGREERLVSGLRAERSGARVVTKSSQPASHGS